MKKAAHARILDFPYAISLQSARLDALQEESRGQYRDLVMDYHELCLLAPLELIHHDGTLLEHVQGRYEPRRLRFVGLRSLECTGLFTQLETLPHEHDARSVRDMLHFCPPQKDPLYLLMDGSNDAETMLMFSARSCAPEARSGPAELVDFVRDWSPTPPLPARLVPQPRKLHQRFGGDPVTIRLGARIFHRRLFVGGVECQGDQRPNVGAVLNLGEDPSRWVKDAQLLPGDRWARKGEGRSGMSVDEIAAEARWVIERLRAGQRVLVHCSAGFNRSVTVCCAVLILLESLSAEAALERVRQHHPWARPDTHHWLALRWLGNITGAAIKELI